MQLSDPQPQLTNRKAPKVLKEGPNRKEEEEEDGRALAWETPTSQSMDFNISSPT